MANYRGGNASPAWSKYDQLPRTLKIALQECRIPWAPGWVYKRFQRGEPVKQLARYIAKIDREHAIKNARKTWGPDYPVDLIR